jgi:protein-glutamine gamma-glutamyltransferase
MKSLSSHTLSLRDTLWLTGALALVAAPHAERLPWWVTSLAITLGGWRVYLGRVHLALPRKWLLLAIVIGATVGIYLNYRTIFGRDAGVALLVVMLALKLLETRTQRDGMLLIFLGFFLVITTFLYAQTIPTALYMLVCVWLITAAMLGLNYRSRRPTYGVQLRGAGVMLAQAAPLMLVLFVLFPRVHGPLWGLPHDAHATVTGLSDTMSPGSFTNLTLSDAVAFRVEFKGALPAPKQLYWRGPVMWDFDGRVWSAPRFYYGEPRFEAAQYPVEYVVTLEPHNKRWMFAIDLPGAVPLHAAASSDFQLLAARPVTDRVRYEMTSYLDARYGIDENPLALNRALNLPPGYNPRAVEFAQTLRRRFDDDKALMREVLAMFRTQNFFYTLSPPPLGSDSVDDFLFNTRRGFCEYYASAFAFLMRAAKIPARVVTGYQGGEINPLGDYMIVRQADAHAWTEVWFRDEGWVRVDPTAAVSPQRVESGIAAAVPATDLLPLMVRGDLVWLRQLRLTWDSLANTWNQWVLGYNPERQRRLLSHAGVDDATWRTLAVILIAATGIVVLALSLLMLRKLRVTVRDPVKRAYLRFCDKLGRKGLARKPAEGPVDYAVRLSVLRPDLAAAADAITRLYVALHYGSAGDDRVVDELQRRVRAFHV